MKSTTSNFKCRLCGSPSTESVIDLDGFPKSAQCFISNLKNAEEDQSRNYAAQTAEDRSENTDV